METKLGKEIKTIVIEDPEDIKWYKEWCLPYLESSKRIGETKKILEVIDRRLCNFLYLLKKGYKHPIYKGEFGIRDLISEIKVTSDTVLLMRYTNKELEEEIKIELDPNTDYNVGSEIRDTLKGLYKEWKEALNNLHNSIQGYHNYYDGNFKRNQDNWVRLKLDNPECTVVLKE